MKPSSGDSSPLSRSAASSSELSFMGNWGFFRVGFGVFRVRPLSLVWPLVKAPFVLSFRPEFLVLLYGFPAGGWLLISPFAFLFFPRPLLSQSPAFRFLTEVILVSSRAGGGPCFFIRRPTPIVGVGMASVWRFDSNRVICRAPWPPLSYHDRIIIWLKDARPIQGISITCRGTTISHLQTTTRTTFTIYKILPLTRQDDRTLVRKVLPRNPRLPHH